MALPRLAFSAWQDWAFYPTTEAVRAKQEARPAAEMAGLVVDQALKACRPR
jgi:hypothetical protein